MIKNLSKKIILLISLLFLFSIALTNVSANEIFISNNDNLSQTIASADNGTTINLQTGTYTINSLISINKNLTIKGNGDRKNVILDAEKNSGIFGMGNNVNVTLINITFINGRAYGGAILNTYANTNLTIINCSFINNTAPSNYGGAIASTGHNLRVENCFFMNNIATNSATGNFSGGAIRSSGNNLTVINSTFINNTANGGGAIYDMGHNFTLIGSSFTNNTAEGRGGALYLYDRTNTTIENCYFNGNTAGNVGGAIYRIHRQNVTIINCTFENNTATNSSLGGGAIYNEGNYSSIINSTFTGNSGGYGGAILNHGSDLTIKNSIFTNNSAVNSGGAIYSSNYTSYTIASDFQVINCTFTGNNARYGGAIYNVGRSTKILDSNFIGNTAVVRGGAVYNSYILNLSSSNFTNNKAETGGGIYNYRYLSVSGNIITGNSADLGNMIYNDGEMGILKLTFLNNSTIKVGKNKIITLFATLTDDMGNTVTGGNIDFLINEEIIGNASPIEGIAQISYTTPNFKGLIPVTGDYDSHIEDEPITLLNGQLSILNPTNTTILVPESVTVGETVNISGVLRDEDGNTIGNVELNVIVNGETFIVNTDENGKWSLSYITAQIGVIEVIAIFAGDDEYLECENRTSFNVENVQSNDTNTINDTEDPNNPIKPPNPNRPLDPSNPNIPDDTEDKNSNNTENNNRLTKKVAMKETGIPIAILLRILSIIIVSIHRKQK